MPVRVDVPSSDAAFSELFDAHYQRMLRAALGLLRDPEAAEDVVQEAFLALFTNWSAVRDPAGYLHRSVVNGARSRLRRLNGFGRLAVAQRLAALWSPLAPSAEDSALAAEMSPSVREALRELPRREREAVLYRYYLDLSEQQAADALGVRVGSVKGYASRGLKTLRASLAAAALVVLVVLGGWFAAHRLDSEPTQVPAGVPAPALPAPTSTPSGTPVPTVATTPAPTTTARVVTPERTGARRDPAALPSARR